MSNREKGDRFASHVGQYLERNGFSVQSEYPIKVGINRSRKKLHHFDYGCEALLVECKFYDWTTSGNNPSAKISTLNEAMLYLYAAPKHYRKMVFISKTRKKGIRNPETLAEHYVRLYGHFVPDDIEIWEFNNAEGSAQRIMP